MQLSLCYHNVFFENKWCINSYYFFFFYEKRKKSYLGRKKKFTCHIVTKIILVKMQKKIYIVKRTNYVVENQKRNFLFFYPLSPLVGKKNTFSVNYIVTRLLKPDVLFWAIIFFGKICIFKKYWNILRYAYLLWNIKKHFFYAWDFGVKLCIYIYIYIYII